VPEGPRDFDDEAIGCFRPASDLGDPGETCLGCNLWLACPTTMNAP